MNNYYELLEWQIIMNYSLFEKLHRIIIGMIDYNELWLKWKITMNKNVNEKLQWIILRMTEYIKW